MTRSPLFSKDSRMARPVYLASLPLLALLTTASALSA